MSPRRRSLRCQRRGRVVLIDHRCPGHSSGRPPSVTRLRLPVLSDGWLSVMPDPNWRRVSRSDPCPVCEGDSWCTVTADGRTVRCMRVSEGARRTDEKGAHIHVLKACSRPSATRRVVLRSAPPNWTELAELRAREATDAQLRPLAGRWGLTRIEPLRSLTCSWSAMWRAHVLPMRRHDGRVVGAHRRWPDGQRKHVLGSRLGLFLPVPLPSGDPLFLPEGPSDVAALLDVDVAAVGRPDNMNGADDCCRIARGRRVVVVGENDQKPDGRWPGREGAVPLAQRLVLHASEVRLLFPPPEFKDVRDWLSATRSREALLDAVGGIQPIRLHFRGCVS
jgi:hypothetical protein